MASVLISQPLAAVGFAFHLRDSAIQASLMALAALVAPTMNDAAVCEAFLTDGVLHHLVVAMGVDADRVISLQGECHCQAQDAFTCPLEAKRWMVA